MTISAEQLAKWFDEATNGDEAQAQRMVAEVKALDDAFGGDLPTVIGSLKLLAGIGSRLKLEVQRDAEYRKVQDLQAKLKEIQAAAQSDLAQKTDENKTAVQAAQAAAALYQKQIDVINAQLPDLLK